MYYIIQYPLYSVTIHEAVGLYSHIAENIGKQFGIRCLEVDDASDLSGWKISLDVGTILIDKTKEWVEKKIEHNIVSLYREENGSRYYVSPRNDWAVSIDENLKIKATVDNDLTAYYITKKILHQISRYENNVNKECLLHASCIVHEKKAFAFVGNKGAGKTTLLLNMLIRNKDSFCYLGNDILALDYSGNVYAMYSKIGIGTGTIDYLNRNLGTAFPILDDEKFYFELGDFLDACEVKCSDRSSLAGIFIITNSVSEELKCTALNKEDMLGLLEENLLKEGKDKELSDHPNWLFDLKNLDDNIELDKVKDYIVSNVNCYSLEYDRENSEHCKAIANLIINSKV